MSKIGSDVLKFNYKTYKESIKTYRIMYKNLKRIQRTINEMVGIKCNFYLKPDYISVTCCDYYRPEKIDVAEKKLKNLGINYQIVYERHEYLSRRNGQKFKKIKFKLPWDIAQTLTDVG